MNYFNIELFEDLEVFTVSIRCVIPKIKCVKGLGLFFPYLLKNIFFCNVVRVLFIFISQEQIAYRDSQKLGG